MTPRLQGQNCKFFTPPLSRNFQKRFEHKENQTKYRNMTRTPRSHGRILMYRTWAIIKNCTRNHVITYANESLIHYCSRHKDYAMSFLKNSIEPFLRYKKKRYKSILCIKLHLKWCSDRKLVSTIPKTKIHQNFRAQKYDIKQHCHLSY